MYYGGVIDNGSVAAFAYRVTAAAPAKSATTTKCGEQRSWPLYSRHTCSKYIIYLSSHFRLILPKRRKPTI